MQFSNTVGLSTVLEGGGSFPGPGVFDEYRDYDAVMALWRERELTVRFRLFFQGWATVDGGIEAIRQRVDNTFMGLGDNMLKVSGLGENVVANTTPIQPLQMFVDAYTIAAEHGWLIHQHSVNVQELDTHTTAFERVNEIIPIADLRWNLSTSRKSTKAFWSGSRPSAPGSPSRTTTTTAAFPWAMSDRPTA